MSWIDIIYLLMLVLSIPLGHVVKVAKQVLVKQVICLGGGLAIVLVLVGWKSMYHSLFVVVGNYFILKLPNYGYRCHHLSFIFVFGYLFFFRTCQYYGFQPPPKHSNAVQLLVTIRMVGAALEKDDLIFSNQKRRTAHWSVPRPLNFSFFNLAVYAYSFIGLMTGPFYKFQTFHDMLYQDGSKIDSVMLALSNLTLLPFLGVPYLVLKSMFPLEYLESSEFLENDYGVLYSHAVVALTCLWFRWRFHIGWLLAESVCIASGLGAYPFESKAQPGIGPTSVLTAEDAHDGDTSHSEKRCETHCFETIHNIKVLQVEKAHSYTQSVTIWNMTVQWWLKHHGRSIFYSQSRIVRHFGTFLTSAYWHGTYSGYYLVVFIIMLALYGEHRLEKVCKHLHDSRTKSVVHWLRYFLHWRSFEFTAVPFMLLRFGPILGVWRKLWFSGFVYLCFLFVSPWIFNSFVTKDQQQQQQHQNVPGKEKKTN